MYTFRLTQHRGRKYDAIRALCKDEDLHPVHHKDLISVEIS